MSLKTLHLTNAWHRSSGGIGTFYRALLEAANQHGHYMRLVVPSEETRVEEVGEFGRIYHLRAPCAPINGNYRMLYPHRFLFPRTAIQRILNDERPDLIEVSEKYTMPYLAGLLRTRRLRGVDFRPTVVGLTCERMDENMAAYISGNKPAAWFCQNYMKWIYFPMFDQHIAVSEHAAAELRPASRGHRVRRGVWIRPMGVDCVTFTPDRKSPDNRRRLLQLAGGDERSVLMVYAGRVVPEKNLPLLIEVMERLRGEEDRDWRLLLAGQGILLEPLRARCQQKLAGCVTFLGHLDGRAALADLLANADVFVHPNPREPFGIAPLEAMSSGVAVVAPNQGGVISYASEKNAWLAEPNAEAFVAALCMAVRETDDRRNRLAAALETAREHSWPQIAADFLRLYGVLNAATQGLPTEGAAPPHFYSTPGNLLGREIAWQ